MNAKGIGWGDNQLFTCIEWISEKYFYYGVSGKCSKTCIVFVDMVN